MNDAPFPDTPARRVKIDLEEVILALGGSDNFGGEPIRYFLNSETGEILTLHPDLEDYDELCERIDTSKPDQFHFIKPLESRESFRIVEGFAESLPESPDKSRLLEALTRNKPFRHFKEAVHVRLELRDQWIVYRDRALEAHAGSWLKMRGIEPDWIGCKRF